MANLTTEEKKKEKRLFNKQKQEDKKVHKQQYTHVYEEAAKKGAIKTKESEKKADRAKKASEAKKPSTQPKQNNTKRTKSTRTRKPSTTTNSKIKPTKNYDAIGEKLNQQVQKTKQETKDIRQDKKTAQREANPSVAEQERAEMQDALVKKDKNKAATKIQSLARAKTAATKATERKQRKHEKAAFDEKVQKGLKAKRQKEAESNKETPAQVSTKTTKKPSLTSRGYNAVTAIGNRIKTIVTAPVNMVTALFRKKQTEARPKYNFTSESAAIPTKVNTDKPIIAQPVNDTEYSAMNATEVTAKAEAKIVETVEAKVITAEQAKQLIQANNVKVMPHNLKPKNLLQASPIEQKKGNHAQKISQERTNKKTKPIDPFSI